MRNIFLIALFISLNGFGCKADVKKTNKQQPIKQPTVSISDVKPVINIHEIFDKLLNKYVSASGQVNYKGFAKEKTALQGYLTSLSKVKISSLNKNEQLAFWINAYNAATIDQIVRNYPVKSIQNIASGKVWDKPLPYQFSGENYTLNQIEKQKLVKELGDPRIHFAINCAAVSCPKLLNKAYTSENVQSLLSQSTSAFLNNKTFNKLSPAKAEISNIFNWYKADFSQNGSSVIEFINKYAAVKLKPNVSISFMDYNWGLNEAK